MKLTYSHHNLCSVKFYHVFRETFLRLENFIEFPTSHKRHNEVESCLCLEQKVHTHKERMVNCKQNVFLQQCALYLVILYQYVFPYHFDRVFLSGCFQSCKENFAKRASA